MKNIYLLFTFCLLLLTSTAQEQKEREPVKPNYRLAAGFSPQKLQKLIFSTTIRPHWIKHSDRFWYEYTTSEGKKWYLVDPSERKKEELFDHAEMAAKITKIVRNPFDRQNIGIQNLTFTEDEKRIRFEVQSSKDTVKSKKEIEKLKNKKDTLKKKVFHLEYNLANKELKEIPDTLKEKKQLAWANFSPDTTKVFFAKNYNLYWMDKENYEKAVQDEKDSTIVEHQITTDGEQYYAWGGDEYSTTTGDDKEEKENREKRKAVHFSWSPDGKHFVLTRKDNRHLNPLWVINNVGKK